MLGNLIIFILFQVHCTSTFEILKDINFQTSKSKVAGITNDFSEVPDGDLLMPSLILKYGYPAEAHYVQTSDGYILGIHRIPKPGGKPFLLQHGLGDSSAGYVIPGPKIALGYYLFDLGYDVWLGNARGNRYSRNHTELNPDTDDSFWEFSWHEIGKYDMPAVIDYILKITKFKKVYYAGHSQGTTVFWVMCSCRPEYNKKIALMHALAPIAYMYNLPNPFAPIAKYFVLNPLVTQFKEVPNNLKVILVPLCTAFATICAEVGFIVGGRNPKQLDLSILPTVVSHMPAGCAVRQIVHYFQLIDSGRFCEYDYGIKENLQKYGKLRPLKYELKKITAPVILHYSLNDLLASPIDVKRLGKEISNCIGLHEIPIKEWNHMDFTAGIDQRSVVFVPLINMTNNFDKGTLKKFC